VSGRKTEAFITFWPPRKSFFYPVNTRNFGIPVFKESIFPFIEIAHTTAGNIWPRVGTECEDILLIFAVFL
jgi:hypothetical protein